MGVDVLKSLQQAVVAGDQGRATDLTKEAIKKGLPAIEIIQDGLVPGIRQVGELFGRGEYYLPELLMSGKSMQGALNLVEPLLAKQGASFHAGKYLIGTVQGDIHDIGKKIVAMMLRGNGWEVIDLGVDITPAQFCAEIKSGDYDILGLSTLLTVTMPAAKETIEEIKKAGFRDRIKIMIGGAPVTPEFADKVGADEFAQDAWQAVTKAASLMNKSK